MDNDSEDVYVEDVVAHSLLLISSPVLMVLGMIGNGLSFWIFYPKVLKYKTQSSYCFLAILAILDTVALILSSLVGFISEAFGIHIVILSQCGSYKFFSYLTTDMAIYTIVCMTIDRVISVFYPFKAKLLCTRNRALISTSVVSVFLAGINSPLLFLIPTSVMKNNSTKAVYKCDAPSGLYNFYHLIWPWIDLTVLSFVPFVVLCCLNGAILIRMKRQIRRVHAAGQALDSRLSSQRRTNIVLMTICVAFFITTSPLAVLRLVEPYWTSKDYNSHQKAIHFLLYVVSLTLLSLNNCVNFLLYCLSGREFRKDLRMLICKRETDEANNATLLA